MLARPLCATLLACATASTGIAAAAEPAPSVLLPSAHARLGFERVRFAGDEQRTGLVGTSYLVDVGGVPGLSVGPALYGAITGDRGGFFSLGGEVAWRQRLLGPVGVELGVYAGGGGGGRTSGPTSGNTSGASSNGSGLMLRPHADLVWDLGAVAVGLSLSKVRFSGRQVDSNQLGLVVSANNDFRFVPAERLGEPTASRGRAGLGFDRIQFSGGVYRTPRGKTLEGGEPLPRTISLVGVRAEQSWGNNGFWGIEANRAGRGDVGGYAELLGTVGLEKEVLRNTLTVGARVAVGMGGGGGVSTGGGLLAKAGLYSILRLGSDLGLALEGGYARAPNGNFRAAQGSLALVWALDGPGTTIGVARPSRTEFSAGVARYDAPRVGRGTQAVSGVTLKVDRYLALGAAPNFYVTGQVFGATGGQASGYSSALVGGGWKQPVGERLHIGAELLAGAAGGGGVDGRGTLIEPRVYAGVQVTPAVALRAGAGRVKALSGRLDSNVFDLSLNIAYGLSGGN